MSFSMTIAVYRSSLGKTVTLGSAPSESPWNISRYTLATRTSVSRRLGSSGSRPRASMIARMCFAISASLRSSSIERGMTSVSSIGGWAIRASPPSGRAGLLEKRRDVARDRYLALHDLEDLPVFSDYECRSGGHPLVVQEDAVLLSDLPLRMEVGEKGIGDAEFFRERPVAPERVDRDAENRDVVGGGTRRELRALPVLRRADR